MEKNFKITNKKQMERLVELMRIHPDIGRGKLPFGCNKMQLKGTWDKFAAQLNSLGLPIESTSGGGPSTEISLSSLEQSTVELVSMQTQVNPNGSAMGMENQEDSDGAELTIRPEEPSQTIESTEPQLPKNRRKKEDKRLQILKAQAKKSEEDLRNVENVGK